jgi:hypothetical protein
MDQQKQEQRIKFMSNQVITALISFCKSEGIENPIINMEVAVNKKGEVGDTEKYRLTFERIA